GYEEVEVLRGVSLAVRAGEIVCIIGANGAGKSTLLRTVFGMVPPRAGAISFAGEDIARRSSLEVLRRGIGYVPQGRCNFPAMSVEENLEMGAYLRRDARVRGGIEALLARFPMLATKRDGTTILMVEQNAKKALARPQPLRGHRARAARQP